MHEARAGTGKLVLVSGEAGVGKSSVVAKFAAEHFQDAQIAWGICDSLGATQRSVGPVHEIAALLPSARDIPAGTDDFPASLFRTLLEDLLESARPSIVILEDFHWADEITLDFFRFLGRRVQRTNALFVVTYRSDELSLTHPVQLALGEQTGDHVVRLHLDPLSLSAVEDLARPSGRDPALLYEVTGGNSFFVKESLACPDEWVPRPVRDAVIARLMRCSLAARQLVEFVSLSRAKTEGWLLEEVLGLDQTAVDESVDRGLLVRHADALGFRHELARRAVHSSLATERARNIHQRVLDVLAQHGANVDQLLHHAIHAGNSKAVLEYGPRAWASSAHLAAELSGSTDIIGVQRIPVLITLALLRIRRGDSGADELLDEAATLALPTGELSFIGKIAAARAELAWYRGRMGWIVREVLAALDQIQDHTAPWLKGELLWWRSRSQPFDSIPQGIAEPYRLMIAGDWRAAAQFWERKGLRYEQALALSDGPEEALREALALAESLDMRPLAEICRKRLRVLGARGVPRGPSEATRNNPAGLTAKEIEVLRLLVQGCTNAQLARQLYRSTKTVDHHVSAILEKLGVRSRSEAIVIAFELGIAAPLESTLIRRRA